MHPGGVPPGTHVAGEAALGVSTHVLGERLLVGEVFVAQGTDGHVSILVLFAFFGLG